ncbi:MAG: hypothetical protein EHM48_08055 [Planctomycetaceae bacterium]|nr:MAG: hypothetical protein EHM48_08055 [Planctomycetaceae bacterium]
MNNRKVAFGVGLVVVVAVCVCVALVSGTSAAPAKPATSQPTATTPTEAELLAITKARCISCHPAACKNVTEMKNKSWIVPGQPDKSKLYTILGKTKKPGTYHDVTAKEKVTIHDFIVALGKPATKPTSQPAYTGATKK